jgi:hypothetical protein
MDHTVRFIRSRRVLISPIFSASSEQPDDGDKLKAVSSDALKRAAIKLGIGRYLYRLPRLWVEYDPLRRQFVRPPQLP